MVPLLILAVLAAASDKAPAKPAELPPVANSFIVHVSVEEYPRAKDEADLVSLLREDLINTGKGMVDLKLRDRINCILRRLPKEQ